MNKKDKPSKFLAIPEDFIFFGKKVEINKSELLKIEKSHKGLVLREVTVKRGGKTFKQKRWVRSGEDEPKKREKKIEAPEGKDKFNGLSVGDEFLFLGNKIMSIEKIDEKEQTAKLSNGIVYTFEAIREIRKRKEVKQYIPKKEKKEITVKDLKQIKKVTEIIGSAKDGSLTTKERKQATENMEKFVTKLRKEEGDIDNNDRVSKAGNYYTKGNCINFNNYLLSDKKKTFDFETYSLKNISKEEKVEFNKRIKILDKFLDKAPKVSGTSYRAMWWDPNNPEQKEKFDNFMKDLVPGKIVESKPYSSTTASKKMMKDFNKMAKSGDIVAEVEYEGTGVYLGDESKEPGQLEVLYKQGIKFEVVSVEFSKNKKKVNIKFREVGYE